MLNLFVNSSLFLFCLQYIKNPSKPKSILEVYLLFRPKLQQFYSRRQDFLQNNLKRIGMLNPFDKNISKGFIISRGLGYALSTEISLKFKELCQEQIESFSSAEVMHGPKSLIQNSFKLFT